MTPVKVFDRPNLRPGSDRGVLHFRGIRELPQFARNGQAGRIARPPNHRQPLSFVGRRSTTHGPWSDVSPIQQGRARACSCIVPDAGEMFVNQRRGHERVLPRTMPCHPTAHHRGKFSDLDVQHSIAKWIQPQRVLVESAAYVSGSRIKSSIGPKLRKRVNGRA
jgi:hypothetical protein